MNKGKYVVLHKTELTVHLTEIKEMAATFFFQCSCMIIKSSHLQSKYREELEDSEEVGFKGFQGKGPVINPDASETSLQTQDCTQV